MVSPIIDVWGDTDFAHVTDVDIVPFELLRYGLRYRVVVKWGNERQIKYY